MAPRDSPPPSSSSKPQRPARHSPQSSDARRRRPAAPPAVTPADVPPQSPPAPPVSAGRLHYSLPPLPSMNPNYPPHHSPYIPPQHYPHPHHPLPGPGPVGTNGGPMPGMYPYGLPPHPHPPPYAHPYGYHQYGPLGPGGFPPPRPPDVPHQSPQPASTPAPSTPAPGKGLKRKRKSEDRTKSEEDVDNADLKKRTKTQRACDSCRSRKIRCDVLPDVDPPQCQHCKQYGFDCTFFLPITETRFKKKRLEEEAAAAAAAADKHDATDSTRPTATPKSDALAKAETKVLGPTSAAFLLHSTATVPTRAYENFDLRYHHTWEVSKSGDGFIQVTEPTPSDSAPTLSRSIEVRVERDVVERLVNSYFNDLAPMFTVVSRDEFLSSTSPPPVLLYAICSVAAACRDVPPAVFDNLRHAISTVIKAEDVLSTASTVNLQALLVLGMCADCHSQFVSNALSAFWLRLGTAIRMAQDLGLHRAESVKQNLDLRRRLWAACVITDRWCSLTYGHPFMIDVEDCDVRLTSSEAIEDMYMNELLKLSILLGRVLKMIYSPSGLVLATDEGLEKLLADIDKWNENLPAKLQYQGATSPQHAGLLHLFYTCVCMLFWRVFMRISYTVPAHLKFALSIERWSGLVQLSRESIDWLDGHERMYDVWMLVPYCATSCALVQYHTWARRQDPEAAATLRKLRDCIKRWESSLQSDHRSTRRKTAEIIALLYESTQTPSAPSTNTEPMNPTVGVRPRGKFPEALRGLMFRKDPSQPGGGVFVAAERPSGDYSDLPKGTIVLKGESLTQGVAKEADVHTSSGLTSSSSLINFTPLSNLPNVNPALNGALGPQQVQVMNVLDEPAAPTNLEQFAVTDNGLLEGIPGSMFDWDQWDTFFARFSLSQDPAAMQALAHAQAAGALVGINQAQAQVQAQAQAQVHVQAQAESQVQRVPPQPSGAAVAPDDGQSKQ